MSKIKILVDAHVFDDSFQGTTTYIQGIYSALVKNEKFEITLAAKDIENLKKVFTHPRFNFIQLKTNINIIRLAYEFPKLIKENHFHFAHFQYITPFVNSCKYINTLHDILFIDYPQYFPVYYKLINGFFFKRSAKNSDIVCTVSKFSKTALTHHYQLESNKIIITPNAVSIKSYNKVDVRRLYKIEKFILFVSRLEPRKNHYTLIKAFVELKLYEQGYHLVFIGRLKDLKSTQFTNYYNNLNKEIKKCILLLENVNQDELSSFYSSADLFVYPSFAEGFGIPPIEAAAHGCKVLCSNQASMSDFDFFGEYLFNPNDSESLKKLITQSLQTNSYPFEHIKSEISKRFNWEESAIILAKKIESYL
jgi:glycosyltransferase involved in cell wall biosynthesis